MWTAFGIMLGFIVDLGFYFVQDHNPHIKGLKWRLMLGSAGIPAFIVMALGKPVTTPVRRSTY